MKYPDAHDIFQLLPGASMGTNCWMVTGQLDGLLVEKSVCSKQRRLPELIVHLRLFLYIDQPPKMLGKINVMLQSKFL
jgi:hypothetical protein